jgi:uncharacterized RDD family membrane protein YckC
MSIERIPPKQYPRVDFQRRAAAWTIDFFGAWLASSFFGNGSIGIQLLQIFVFIFLWLILRVLVPYNNQGQSLGRWALDIKVLEAERGRIPDLLMLGKREGIVGFGAVLASTALNNIMQNPAAILLVIPLAIDCAAAFGDTMFRQALHDRYADTMVVSSRRGYSLDIKVKRIVENMRRNMQK